MAPVSVRMLVLPVLLLWTRLRSTTGTETPGFMAVGTTLSEEKYDVTYEIRTKKPDANNNAHTYIDDKLSVRLVTPNKTSIAIPGIPSPHALLSRFGTKPEAKFLVLKKLNVFHTQIAQHRVWTDEEKQQELMIDSFSTTDLLGNALKKEIDAHSSFWLLDRTGIHCFRFDKDGKFIGDMVTIHTFKTPLITSEYSPTDHSAVQKRIHELMTDISKQWQETTATAAATTTKEFTAFATTLKTDVVYKRFVDEPLNKKSKRRSFTEDIQSVFLLENNLGSSFPPFFSLLSHVGTSVETIFYVRNVSLVQDSRNVKQYSDLNEKQETVQVKQLASQPSPKKLFPVLDILPPHENPAQYMYTYSTFDLLAQKQSYNATVLSSIWFLDGEGIKCFRFNRLGRLVGEMLTVVIWAEPLPTHPESPTDAHEITILMGQLMEKIREKRADEENETLGMNIH